MTYKTECEVEEKFLHTMVVQLYVEAIWWDKSSQVLEVVYNLQRPKKAVVMTYWSTTSIPFHLSR
jgi:hypothetical protein